MAQIFYFCGHEQYQPEVLLKHAVLAEKAGFDGLFVSEHFNPWVADVGASGFAFSTLGAIAAQTLKVKLMTGVVTPLFRYHPAVVAQAAATIDRLSGGRFSLGVGTGESINEAALGYEFPAYKERSVRMKESLLIMKKLLTGETVSFSGEFYKTEHAHLYSPPIRNVPIFLAAGGPKTATLAGEYADGVIVSVKNPNDTIEKVIKPAKEKTKELSKKLSVVASRWTIFAQNPDEAWGALGALGAWRGLRAPSRDHATDPRELQKEADELPREEILSRYTIVSSAEEYMNAYKPLIKTMKADIVVIQTSGKNQEELIQLLGAEVVPTLKHL